MFWPAQNALLVADLHLEKLSSYAQSGQLLPPYDTGLTLARLAADLRNTKARMLISLGDNFHRDRGSLTLRDADRTRLTTLLQDVDWIWLSGNHDPAPHTLGGRCLPQFELAGLTLAHEPRHGAYGLIAGHLHPAARVSVNGRSARRPCFVHDERIFLMPAYGSSTGSINILGPAFAGLFQLNSLSVTMLGQDRLYPVHPKRLARG
jgi:uncharacterized protein